MHVVYLDVSGNGKQVPVPCKEIKPSEKIEGMIDLVDVTQSREMALPTLKVNMITIRPEHIIYISTGINEEIEEEEIEEEETEQIAEPIEVEVIEDNWHGRRSPKRKKKKKKNESI